MIVFGVPIVSVSANAEIQCNATLTKKVVKVEGTISSGAGQQVTLLVTDSNGAYIYIDQTTSETDGKFSFNFPMPDGAKDGNYTVKVGGTNVSSSAETNFVYYYDNISVQEPQVTNNWVRINGSISSGTGHEIALLVKDPTHSIIYIDQTTSETDGKFCFNFPMPDGAKSGIYTVKVGGPNVLPSVQTNFDYYKEDISKPEITATAQYKNGRVHVNGTISSGAGQQVTLMVKDPTNTIIYTDQTTSETGGNFSFKFPLPDEAKFGTYTVTVGGTNVPSPTHINFGYSGESFYGLDIQVTNSHVCISGSITSGADQQVTLLVTDPMHTTIYTGETISGTDGKFCFDITMPDFATSGIYTVKLSGKNVVPSVQTDFIYYNDGFSAVSVQVANNQVSVDGTISSGADQEIEIKVTDSTGTMIRRDVITCNSDGKFSYSFSMPDSATSGIYTVTLKKDGIEEPEQVLFLFTTELPAQAIEKNQNKSLYNALKRARPLLDPDADGTITALELSNISGALDISNSNIESLYGLQSCTGITELYINDNKISNLQPIENLQNLKSLIADNNQLSHIAALPTNLKLLNVERNQLTNMEGVTLAQELEILFASENNLSSIDFLRDKTALTHVTLKNNTITDLSPLANDKALIHVDLADNLISDISVLGDKTNIKVLRLSGNPINSLSAIPKNFFHILDYVTLNLREEILKFNALNTIYTTADIY